MADSQELVLREFSLEPPDNERLANLCGPLDENLRLIESRLGVEVRRRGSAFRIKGVKARAAEALLMGEPFFAEAAQEVGLVNRVVPPTEVNGHAQAQAKKLAAKPLSSLIETKRLMKGGQSKALIERMGEEGQSFRRMLTEPAAREAFGAFMEKRKPDFTKI